MNGKLKGKYESLRENGRKDNDEIYTMNRNLKFSRENTKTTREKISSPKKKKTQSAIKKQNIGTARITPKPFPPFPVTKKTLKHPKTSYGNSRNFSLKLNFFFDRKKTGRKKG